MTILDFLEIGTADFDTEIEKADNFKNINSLHKIVNHNYNKFLIIDDNMINSTLLKLMIIKILKMEILILVLLNISNI